MLAGLGWLCLLVLVPMQDARNAGPPENDNQDFYTDTETAFSSKMQKQPNSWTKKGGGVSKRSPVYDIGGAWKTMLSAFPGTIQDVIINAQARYAGTSPQGEQVEYGTLGQDYQTSFSTETEGFRSSRRKRSGEDWSYGDRKDSGNEMFSAELSKALENYDLAEKIIEESKNPEEAIRNMMEAGKAVDEALHKILGNLHHDDTEDIEMLEKFLKKSSEDELGRANVIKSKRDVENVVKKSVANMAKAKKILEEENDEEKALLELMSAEQDLDNVIYAILGPNHSEKLAKARQRRDQGSGYYDPQFKWLASELNVEPMNLHKLAQEQEIRNTHAGFDLNSQYSYKPAYKSTYPLPSPSYVVPPQYAPTFNPSYSLTPQYSQQPLYSPPPTAPQVPYYKSALQRLASGIMPLRNSIPLEVEAALQGALEMGMHLGSRVKPVMDSGYQQVTYKYLPQAIDRVAHYLPDDLKNFARQGKTIVENRARLAAEAAQPRLEKLKEDLQLLRAQVNQVVAESSEYTTKEVVPNVDSALRGLLFDMQETLELASTIVNEDVKPLVGKINEKIVKPTLTKVGERVLRPTTDALIAQNRPAYETYVLPAYNIASDFASGISSAAETSKVVYEERFRAKLEDLAVTTQQVFEEKVKPAMEGVASNVGDRAGRMSGTFQSDMVPQLKDGISTALNGVFTTLPNVVEIMSQEATDAARVFSGKYSEALKKIRARVEQQKLEKAKEKEKEYAERWEKEKKEMEERILKMQEEDRKIQDAERWEREKEMEERIFKMQEEERRIHQQEEGSKGVGTEEEHSPSSTVKSTRVVKETMQTTPTSIHTQDPSVPTLSPHEL